MSQPEPPKKKLSLADLIGEPETRSKERAPQDSLARELSSVIDWKEQLRKEKETSEQPKVLRMLSTDNFVDPMRETNRRIRASEEAERRTVAALETMLKEAQASKADNASMLWWARVAGIAGIAAVVLTVLVPVVQAWWTKAP